MSVHGEYGRALDAFLICVQRLESPLADEWTAKLMKARSSQNPDLSTAATVCLRVLDAIDAERSLSSPAEIGPETDPLREPFANLRAHCRAVLGTADQTAEM